MKTPIYTGIKVFNSKHVTIDYNPGNPQFPEGIQEGETVIIHIIGLLTTPNTSCFQVEVLVSEHSLQQQQNGTPLHITIDTAENIKPVQSGIELKHAVSHNLPEDWRYDVLRDAEWYIQGTWFTHYK